MSPKLHSHNCSISKLLRVLITFIISVTIVFKILFNLQCYKVHIWLPIIIITIIVIIITITAIVTISTINPFWQWPYNPLSLVDTQKLQRHNCSIPNSILSCGPGENAQTVVTRLEKPLKLPGASKISKYLS